MNTLITAGASLALAIGAHHAAAQEDVDDDTVFLAPSTEWRLREMDDRCRLSRVFGEGEDRTTLWIDQGGPEPNFNLTIIGKPVRHPFGPQTQIQFAPEPAVTRDYIKSESSRGRPVIAMFGVTFAPDERESGETQTVDENEEETVDLSENARSSANDVDGVNIHGDGSLPGSERLASITSLRVDRAMIKPFALLTGPMDRSLVNLNGCATKLSYRLAAGGGAGGMPALPTEVERWAAVLQQNYPRHMLRTKQEGTVAIRLTIATNGKASNCHIRGSTRPQAFDDTVCLLLLRHATFEPARNDIGEAVPAFYSTEVTFRLN